MNKNPFLLHWQQPARKSFSVRRGVALLRAWRLRFAQQAPDVSAAIQLDFPQFIRTRRSFRG
jgi:hypothetical protein